MIGVLLIAHAPLASALAAAGAHVYACAPQRAQGGVRALDVPADADVEETVAQARRIVHEIDDGGGVLVLTDAFGASPANIARRLIEPGRVAVLAGVNLPMLLRVLCYRDRTLAEAVDKALAGGAAGIMRVPSEATAPTGDR